MSAPGLLAFLGFLVFLGAILKKFIICNDVLTLIPFLPRRIGISAHRGTAVEKGIEGI